jgi:hypothetical protein
MADRIGQQLGNYRLTRLLGEGGFAQVYLGEHIHLGTEAAIKVLTTRLSRGDRAIPQRGAYYRTPEASLHCTGPRLWCG